MSRLHLVLLDRTGRRHELVVGKGGNLIAQILS
jgi:hypothetical protein